MSVKAESDIREGIEIQREDLEESTEEESKKKKHRREKVGFRDRKVCFFTFFKWFLSY